MKSTIFFSLWILCCFLISCFGGFNSEKPEILVGRGLLESSPDMLNKYRMFFLIDDEVYNTLECFLDENFQRTPISKSKDTRVKEYLWGFCNAVFSNHKSGCSSVRTGEFDMSVVLENVETGTKIPLGIQHVKMNEYKHTLLLAQVFIGSDRGLYKKRPKNEFNWDVATAVYSEDIQDTIFYYYKKYKRDSYIDVIDVDFKEVK